MDTISFKNCILKICAIFCIQEIYLNHNDPERLKVRNQKKLKPNIYYPKPKQKQKRTKLVNYTNNGHQRVEGEKRYWGS